MDWKKPLENIRGQLKYYLGQHSLNSLVLGVSGGVDSALVAAIASPVCKELKIPLIGRSLPHSSNKPDELKRADDVGKEFCTDYKVCTINFVTDFVHNVYLRDSHHYSINEDEKFNKIAFGNVKARLRMIHLYDLAYRTRGMVLSTDNLTELLVGFWTLHGDVGDYGMIQNLWKTEVYDLSRWMCVHDNAGSDQRYQSLYACIEAVPTDGLGITSSDLEQLGAPTYDEVDKILKTWLTYDHDSFHWDSSLEYPGRIEDLVEFFKYRESLRGHPLIQRHLITGFKRKGTINLTRAQIFTHGE